MTKLTNELNLALAKMSRFPDIVTTSKPILSRPDLTSSVKNPSIFTFFFFNSSQTFLITVVLPTPA